MVLRLIPLETKQYQTPIKYYSFQIIILSRMNLRLDQMILKDKTRNEAYNLDYGYAMDRNFNGGEWTITKLPEDDGE